MKNTTLLAMLAAAAVLGALALWTGSARKPQTPRQIGKPVLPGLRVNDVRRIELAKGERTVTLADTGDGWVASSLHNYPADFAKVRENLLALRDLKVGDVQRGARLDAATATLVDLQDANGKSLASLRLGDVRTRNNPQFGWDMPDGRAVAANNDDTVFLVAATLNAFDPDVKTWLDSLILDVPTADIAAIVLTGPEGSFTLDRASGALALSGLATNETFDTSRTYSVESALSNLRFADLADPALDDETTGIATGRTFTVTTRDGTRYTARVGGTPPDRAERYARFSVTAEPVSTNAAERAEVVRKAAERHAAISPWLYLLSAWSSENMTRSRAEFVKPSEPAKPEEDETSDPAPTTPDPET